MIKLQKISIPNNTYIFDIQVYMYCFKGVGYKFYIHTLIAPKIYSQKKYFEFIFKIKKIIA